MWIVIPVQTMGSLQLDLRRACLNTDLQPAGLPSGQHLPQTTRLWTLLAEPRLFGVPKTKLFLPGSFGLIQLPFPRWRISLPAHQVVLPKRQVLRPNVLLRP